MLAESETLEAALLLVADGNAGKAPPGFVRDLGMRKREYWETRPYPSTLWHWTEAEFGRFLVEHRFPPNTLRDREQGRLQAIREALVRGDFVPPEVMHDAATAAAVRDAVIDLRAAHALERSNRLQKAGIRAYEEAIGLGRACDEYERRLEGLLARAVCDKGRPAQDHGWFGILSDIKASQLEGLPYKLTLSLRMSGDTRQRTRKGMWIEIRDARYNDVSLFGSVGRLSFDQAERVLLRLLESGAVTLAQARTLMGWQWMPYTAVAVS